MNLVKWKEMDPLLLLGLVNTELRNHSESLDDLLKTHDLPKQELKQKLREVGYEYCEEQKRFR